MVEVEGKAYPPKQGQGLVQGHGYPEQQQQQQQPA